MENNILRSYPREKDERVYKKRYNEDDFAKYHEIAKSRENYEKWKIGINFKTNRKIKIGGKTHEKLGYENFYIKHDGYLYILFTELDGIDIDSYIEKTKTLKKEIEDYNSKVKEIICEINLLEKWEEYILFEGEKYGIPHVYKNIHRENNCLGLMTEYYSGPCTCHLCEDWGGCNNPATETRDECEKCGFRTCSR